MPKPAPLEVTITHNLDDPAEVAQLFQQRLIALDWNRKGPNIASYTHRRARIDVKLFHAIRNQGAAVIAAYKGATDKPSDRLVGWVEPGSRWRRLNGLLCLPLAKARVVDSSSSFLGNLPPRQCTIQTCHRRSAGQLLRLVSGTALVRGVESLHHRDVEWLVRNFLFSQGLCATQWSGCQSYEDIDHAGYSRTGREVLAQTTVSRNLVGRKAERLLLMKSARRDLLMFGPEEARDQCPSTIRYWAIEEVFKAIDNMAAGRSLINRMLAEIA
jgi:hypothetical protein